MNSLPIGLRTPPPLIYLILSRQTFSLKIITFPAESCGYELIISAENNTSLRSVIYCVCFCGRERRNATRRRIEAKVTIEMSVVLCQP